MEGTNNSSDLMGNQERTLGEAPCQNCGKMVTISLPFVGCVFCGDCITSGDTGQYDGTEDFYDRRRELWPFLDEPVKRNLAGEITNKYDNWT